MHIDFIKIKLVALWLAIKYELPHSIWCVWMEIKMRRHRFIRTYAEFKTAMYNDLSNKLMREQNKS